MTYTVGLLDSDVGYGQALMEYINMRAKIPLQMSYFSDTEKLQLYLRTNSLTLLLVGDEWWHMETNCRVLILTEDKRASEKEGYIFRYQSVEKILQELSQYLQMEMVHRGNNPRFYGVISPVGRCGKTLLAKELCRNLGNCLYVDWQGPSVDAIDNELGARFLYCLKSRNEELNNILNKVCNQKEMELPSSGDYRDLRQMDREDLIWFREQLRQRGDGICAVFDVGDTVLNELNVLKEFDQIYIPYLKEDISRQKVDSWKGLVTKELGDAAMQKMHMVDMAGREVQDLAKEIEAKWLF